MSKRLPPRPHDEQDVLTAWRHVMHWSPGEKQRIKRRYRRRERHTQRRFLQMGGV